METDNKKTYYFLGIGGIGMSAVARYLHLMGNCVMGYDRVESEITKQLMKEGIQINYEDREENVPENIDLCIYTPAVPKEGLQFRAIERRGIPMKKRSEALEHITSGKKVLAVAGSHGKTTTTGMIAHILSCSEIGCSAFLGGILKSADNNFLFNGKSPYVVVEADEYDRSFLHLKPYVSVITSIDADHLDIYENYENLYQAFIDFALLTEETGQLIVKTERSEILEKIESSVSKSTYALENFDAMTYAWNIRIYKGEYYFDFVDCGETFYDMQMIYPGKHNIENAVAAMKVCNFVLKQENLSKEQRESILRVGLKTFTGMKRRLDYVVKTENRIFIDDYAHHPKEIQASILSLREMYPTKHLTGIFQPHLYTRTRDLAEDFARSLEMLDTVILLPIYPAREKPIEGVSSHLILHRINKMDKYYVTKEQLYPLLEALHPELLITMGAGDIDREVLKIKERIF
ncbi:MAG: UDP-N-acetylmuramate--L-alanine ligase [Bacteroidales bacterium]|nr:UDP-N-acetylmuramate--L-alanine ligase [Bacteroidales bacterium]